ncbi:hypothetical protein ACS0TY_017340 [Phlomoides rotata]
MTRCWINKGVLQKLGETMGFAVGESGTSASDAAGEDEAGEVNVEESILHHTASVGDLVDSKSALADGADYKKHFLMSTCSIFVSPT